ncbi:MAG: helicase-related protein, partial [Ilumatobacter sp.]|nr:helicase-related protein [Ilumatobacter sp.]
MSEKLSERDASQNEPLFIVDNAEGGRSGIEYLREWCELATKLDIATGYFEIGALLQLDGDWQKLDEIRILMGDEVTHRTSKAMLEAVRSRAQQVIDDGLENDKRSNPFLTGVQAIVEAMKSGQIKCAVYNQDKFHAKAYITHGKFDVVGSQALVGSSNFTVPGLNQNVELNIKLESSSEVAQLQAWYERHWGDAVDVKEALVPTVTRHIHEYSPFDIYARALHELFVDQQPSVSDWEQNRSEMFSRLDRYQQEAYWAMMKIARQHGGALLCDGVGLGKTFVGLMLIERLVMQERKKVVLFAPKAAKDAVWTPELHRYLSHVGGTGEMADFSNLTVFSHTDLTRPGDFPARFKRITEQADAIVIDEAHHFRNPGKAGETWDEISRYNKLYRVLGGGPEGTKELFMLTATPINNSLDDFRHMVELFTQRDDSHFARTLGVNSVRSHVSSISKSLQQKLADQVGVEVAPDVEAFLPEATELLAANTLFSNLVVQRSRAYARQSQIQETGNAAAFPVRSDPQVAEYSVKKTYGRLLDMVERAFERDKPLFALPMYYPLAYYTGPDDSIDPTQENRERQVVGLIRTNFLKRFESSVYSFERSCDRLMRKLLAFVDKNSHSPNERQRYQRWLGQHEELLGYTSARQLEFWSEEEEEEEEEDVVTPELLEAAEKLEPDEYDLTEILSETFLDLEQLAQFLNEAKQFDPKKDDKLQKLIRLLKTKALTGRKVLIFTEFADTARYICRNLKDAGIDGVFELDSGTKANRAEILKRFSPYYNSSSSSALAAAGLDEIRVLVATDVLSEGLNLQDATNLINYDIHWNPVRLMQRIGRVDRRLNPDTEERLKADH